MKKTGAYIGPRRLHVESYIPDVRKHGAPILFLHGAYAGSWSWRFYLEYFCERGWECHASNLRGHYLSAPVDLSTVHFADLVDDVVEVAGSIGKKLIVIGTSSGGIMAQKYVEGHAAAAAVLLNSIPPKGIPLAWVDPVSNQATPAIVQLERESFRAEFPDVSEEDFDRYFQLLSIESGVAAKEWRGGIDIDPSRVSCPVLVVGSELDTRITPGVSQKVAEYYRGEYMQIEGASHLGILLGQRWEQAARQVDQWLEAQGL